MKRVVAALALFCALAAGVAHGQPMRTVENPAEHSKAMLVMLEADGADRFARELESFLKNAKGTDKIAENLRPFSKRRPDVSGVARDRDHNGLVRTILYYYNYDDSRFPFLYYLFTYKKTAQGWSLTNFRFESELSRAFPEDFLAQ